MHVYIWFHEIFVGATKTDEEIVSWEDADDSTPKEESKWNDLLNSTYSFHSVVVKPEELENYLNQLDENTETKLEPVESVQKSSTKSESVEKGSFKFTFSFYSYVWLIG